MQIQARESRPTAATARGTSTEVSEANEARSRLGRMWLRNQLPMFS